MLLSCPLDAGADGCSRAFAPLALFRVKQLKDWVLPSLVVQGLGATFRAQNLRLRFWRTADAQTSDCASSPHFTAQRDAR